MDIFIVGIGDMIILSDAPCPCLNEPFLEGSALNKAAAQQASSQKPLLLLFSFGLIFQFLKGNFPIKHLPNLKALFMDMQRSR